MTIEDEKILLEKIKLRIRKRKRTILQRESRRKVIRFFFFNTLIFLFFNIFYIFKEITTKELTVLEITKLVFLLLATVFFTRFAYFLGLRAPKEKDIRDEWYWNIGRKLYLSRSLYPLFLAIVFLLEIVSSEIIPDTLVVVALVFACIYSSIILTVINRPTLVISRKITGVGSAIFIGELLIVLILILKYDRFWQLDFSPLSIFLIPASLIVSVLIYHHLSALWKKNELNIVQTHALNIIKPVYLVKILKDKSKNISDKIRALKYIRKKMKKDDYGFLQALGEELIIDENRQSKGFLGLIVTCAIVVIIFIIESIGEGLVQDIFNDSIKMWLCQKVGFFCEV